MARYRCTVCNWVYDEVKEGVKFSDQPDSYHCPNCGAPKSAFVPVGLVKGDASIEATVADKIVEQLVHLGIKYIYGIPGDSNLPLIEAVRKNGRIRFVLTRHEETAAFMACAHGKITDTMGVCISIAGPGSTNLVTGLMDAAEDRSPVLALVGQVAEVYLGSEAFQEIDQLELFHPFTVFSETVARPSQAIKLTMMAVKYAYKQPGVAVLSTPTDVLAEKSDQKIFKKEKRIFRTPSHPKMDDIQAAAALINESRKIVLLAGWGVRHHGDAVLALARKLKAPVATTSRAKGMIHETDEYSLGVLGSLGSKHAARSIQSANLLIVIGTGFRHANLVPTGTTLIQIDIDPTRIGRTFDVDAGIIADAGAVLHLLSEKAKEKKADKEFWDDITAMKQKHQQEIENDAKDVSKPINPGFLIQSMKRTIANDAIICVDVGDHTYWFYKKFVCEGQRTFLSANVASMGFGLPAALAAQLDYPDKQVVCLTGDGGFAMLASDFTTAVRENLGITVIVCNDGRLKNIKKEQKRDGYPMFGVSFPNPNFAEFAFSCGGEGYRVREPTELDGILKTALASQKPTLVEVMVDPEKMAVSGKRLD
jgi:pyruvate oxidase